jgi:hypothetical protein
MVNDSLPYWMCGDLRQVGYNICTGNGECSGGTCLCNIGYVESDCSRTFADFSMYVPMHWSMFTLNAIATILVTWRLLMVIQSKVTRSQHRRCWTKFKGVMDTQTGVLSLIWLGAAGHTIFFADPWSSLQILHLTCCLVETNVGPCDVLLAIGVLMVY